MEVQTNFGKIWGGQVQSGQICRGLSGQKVLFQDQASPTIARGPHPSRVPDFTHGVLVRHTYIGKDCILKVAQTYNVVSFSTSNTLLCLQGLLHCHIMLCRAPGKRRASHVSISHQNCSTFPKIGLMHDPETSCDKVWQFSQFHKNLNGLCSSLKNPNWTTPVDRKWIYLDLGASRFSKFWGNGPLEWPRGEMPGPECYDFNQPNKLTTVSRFKSLLDRSSSFWSEPSRVPDR